MTGHLTALYMVGRALLSFGIKLSIPEMHTWHLIEQASDVNLAPLAPSSTL